MSKKEEFEEKLREFAMDISTDITAEDGQWLIKGCIDAYKKVYSISTDTKVVSKILEIHIFPILNEFAKKNNYKIVLAQHQNYYPDLSFIDLEDENVKFAVDLKTTYREKERPWLCNGFTLGSHGEYFKNKQSTKNIQFPYGSYLAHYCLGIIYDRIDNKSIDDLEIFDLEKLESITSVIGNFTLFVAEKWKIASDKSGSGNTANIGSITRIDDIVSENGMFSKLGEIWFEDYWMNYGQINRPDGSNKKINSLCDFVKYKNGDLSLIVERNNKE